jgi:hypothetical protein
LRARQYKRQSEINADNSHKEKPLEHEYWFAVPKEKYDKKNTINRPFYYGRLDMNLFYDL